jgi:hypothetical protein
LRPALIANRDIWIRAERAMTADRSERKLGAMQCRAGGTLTR